MIKYSSLRTTPLADLHIAFLEAFSDYQVQMNIPFPKFESMLRRRGYSADLSVGAFLGNKLVGFVLNGCRIWDDKKTLYNCGTGVIPNFRQQGITTHLFQEIYHFLEAENIERYLLEVIQTNRPAVKLYEKLGFTKSRILSSYRLEQPLNFEDQKNPVRIDVQNVYTLDWGKLCSFGDVQPTWQNSINSVLAVSESFLVVTAIKRGKVAGYAVMDIQSGDIAQLAVHKEYRSQGVGTSIIHHLFQNRTSVNVSMTNVDDRSASMKAFLTKIGFQNSVAQYEMVLSTKSIKQLQK